MPSPFAGMDPYLEGELWTNFHTQFAVAITHQLNPKLTPRYVAVTEKYQNTVGPEEIAIGADADLLSPDVGVSQTSTRPRGAGAVSIAQTAFKIDTVISIPVDHVWVKILHWKHRLLVTAIEFLSPTNKRGQGRLKYLRKRRKLLLSQCHLIEIDLLRKGRRVPTTKPLPTAPYFVFLNRMGHRPEMEVWPIFMDQPLPAVPVPLLGTDETDLRLQAAFDSVYDLGNMEQLIDYTEDPDVALPPDLAAMADARLRAAGKR